jgi:hypothetical protein
MLMLTHALALTELAHAGSAAACISARAMLRDMRASAPTGQRRDNSTQHSFNPNVSIAFLIGSVLRFARL